MIRTSDKGTIQGDILVGAGGAYSAIRQSTHKKLHKEGRFSSSDNATLASKIVALINQRFPLSPEKFHEILRKIVPLNVLSATTIMSNYQVPNKLFSLHWGPR